MQIKKNKVKTKESEHTNQSVVKANIVRYTNREEKTKEKKRKHNNAYHPDMRTERERETHIHIYTQIAKADRACDDDDNTDTPYYHTQTERKAHAGSHTA